MKFLTGGDRVFRKSANVFNAEQVKILYRRLAWHIIRLNFMYSLPSIEFGFYEFVRSVSQLLSNSEVGLVIALAFRITIFDSTVCQASNLALVVCARGLFSFCQIPRLVLCLRRVYTKFDSI